MGSIETKDITGVEMNSKELRETITTMLLDVPQLSPLNTFQIFTSDDPSPDDFVRSDEEDLGIFTIAGSPEIYSHMTYTDHERVMHNPYKAACILVSKVIRRMVCHGITPIGMTINLNHISLSSPEHQLIASQVKAGIEKASKVFGVEISNQKMFFETKPQSTLPPTLVVSMVGSANSRKDVFSSNLMKEGNTLFVIGDTHYGLEGSEYQKHRMNIGQTTPMWCDIENEKRTNSAVQSFIKSKFIASANPVGIGGIFFSLLRSCYVNDLGFSIITDLDISLETFLFGESMGRSIVGVTEENLENFLDYVKSENINVMALGNVTSGEVEIDDISFGHISMISVPQ